MRPGFTESRQSIVSGSDCELPCVTRLKRTSADGSTGHSIVPQLGPGSSLITGDAMERRIATTEVNGLVAIPTEKLISASIEVSVTSEFCMWLQVFVA